MRRVNFRSFVYSWIVLMLTALSCLVTWNVPVLGAIMLSIIVFLPLTLALIFRKRLKTYIFATLIMTVCLCVVSSTFFFVKALEWIPSDFEEGKHKVEGTVDDLSFDDAKLIISDLKIDGKKAKGRLVLSRIDYVPNWLDEGDVVSFETSVSTRRLISGMKVNASYLRSDIRYEARAPSTINFSYGSKKFSISGFIGDKLKSSMGERYGAVAFGMLTGDRNEISEEIISDFSASGIAHILAVSGLHIGVLAGIVIFVLKRLKVKRVPAIIVTTIILIAYAAVAGFSPSVTRACVMFAVGGGASLLGEQNDGFNSLGAASTVVLTFSPLMLFEAGFIMSVGAVFGIVAFTPIITRLLERIKMPKKLGSAIAVTTSAQLGIMPPLICFYGLIQTYSIIINLIMLPFMSLTFIAVFIALLFALIPPFGILLKAVSVLVRGMVVGASLGASLPYAQIEIAKSASAFLLYPLYFVMSDFVNLRKSVKVCCLILAIILVVVLVIFA